MSLLGLKGTVYYVVSGLCLDGQTALSVQKSVIVFLTH